MIPPSHDAAVTSALPQARRYARALIGDQDAADRLLAEVLELGVAGAPPALALYAQISRLAPAIPRPHGPSPQGLRLLLLTLLEGLSLAEAAQALALTEEDALRGLDAARRALGGSTAWPAAGAGSGAHPDWRNPWACAALNGNGSHHAAGRRNHAHELGHHQGQLAPDDRNAQGEVGPAHR